MGLARSTVQGVADTSTLGLRSCGVWSRAEALTRLGRGQLDALVRSRTWQVPWRGVHADGGHELDAEQRAWAAVLAAGGAVGDPAGPRLRAAASGRTAARVCKAAHAGAAMVAKDRRRDRRTEAYGWRTERVTWFGLRREQSAVLRRICDVHAGLVAHRHDHRRR